MSFWVWVIRAEDANKISSPDVLPSADAVSEDEWWAAYNKWQEEATKAHLYSAPLGGDGTVYTFWSMIASQIGLPVLTSLYQNGLVLETPGQLEQLEQELDELQAYWDSHELHDEPPSGIHGKEREHLQERIGYLREAIHIARDNGATLGIS